jgi:sec-independent protein translocase protein TatA
LHLVRHFKYSYNKSGVSEMFGMLNIGPWELILILVVVLIVFGPGKLPEVAQSLGKAVKEFRKASSNAQRMWDEVTKEEPVKTVKSSESGQGGSSNSSGKTGAEEEISPEREGQTAGGEAPAQGTGDDQSQSQGRADQAESKG